jgi:hypothetical protein
MAEEYAGRLKALIDSAEDKAAVKKSIGARLYANATMSGSRDLPTSSKDTEIDKIITEFEGDSDMSTEVNEALDELVGGRRKRKTRKHRKTHKPTRKLRQSRKTRKYSRRR